MRKMEFDLSVPALTMHDSSQGKLKLVEDYCICLMCREIDVDWTCAYTIAYKQFYSLPPIEYHHYLLHVEQPSTQRLFRFVLL